jgi:hypothetical protein
MPMLHYRLVDCRFLGRRLRNRLGVRLGLQGRHLVSIRRLPPWYQLGLGHDDQRNRVSKLLGRVVETPWKSR